jgi:dTMP kinase
MDMQMIAWMEDKIQGTLRPDLTLLLDAPIDVGIDRASQRGKLDRFESEKNSFFEKVREVYLQRAKKYPQIIKVINADQDLGKVQSEISLQLQALLAIE